MKQVEYRDNTTAFKLPKNKNKYKPFHQIMFQGMRNEKVEGVYNFVMLMGLSNTGKSTFLTQYEVMDNWSATKWNRDQVFDMMFSDGERPEKYYGKINRFEKDVLSDLIERDFHQVLVEGWNRKKKSRKRYLNFIKNVDNIDMSIVVFDGPTERIVKRNKTKKTLNMSDAEIESTIKEQKRTMEWPTWSEGWDDIYYVTTFGDQGLNYFEENLK